MSILRGIDNNNAVFFNIYVGNRWGPGITDFHPVFFPVR